MLIVSLISFAVFISNQTVTAQCGQKLLASDGEEREYFGHSVSISGDVAIIGAWGDNANAGSAYIFRWNGVQWIEEQKLLASDGVSGDNFGYSVSISGDVTVIGARNNGDYYFNAGSAYIFRWNGVQWIEEQNLHASDRMVSDLFGGYVSVSDDVAVIGAFRDDNNGLDSGSVYIFRWNGSEWIEEQKLLASDGAPEDWFGWRLSI